MDYFNLINTIISILISIFTILFDWKKYRSIKSITTKQHSQSINSQIAIGNPSGDKNVTNNTIENIMIFNNNDNSIENTINTEKNIELYHLLSFGLLFFLLLISSYIVYKLKLPLINIVNLVTITTSFLLFTLSIIGLNRIIIKKVSNSITIFESVKNSLFLSLISATAIILIFLYNKIELNEYVEQIPIGTFETNTITMLVIAIIPILILPSYSYLIQLLTTSSKKTGKEGFAQVTLIFFHSTITFFLFINL